MLKDTLLAANRRSRVVDECVQLVDEQVASKSGLSGVAVRAVYAVVGRIKPAYVREAVDALLDDFVARLEPHHADWSRDPQGATFESYLCRHATRVADDLLGVTDARAGRAKNATVRKSYEKLRPTAAKHVEAALPGIARIVARHSGSTAAA
jgi:hypothetical protein